MLNKEPRLPRIMNVLTFWEEQKERQPELYTLARMCTSHTGQREAGIFDTEVYYIGPEVSHLTKYTWWRCCFWHHAQCLEPFFLAVSFTQILVFDGCTKCALILLELFNYLFLIKINVMFSPLIFVLKFCLQANMNRYRPLFFSFRSRTGKENRKRTLFCGMKLKPFCSNTLLVGKKRLKMLTLFWGRKIKEETEDKHKLPTSDKVCSFLKSDIHYQHAWFVSICRTWSVIDNFVKILRFHARHTMISGRVQCARCFCYVTHSWQC